MKKALIASVIILLLLLVFSLSNTEPIKVIFIKEFTIMPTILVLISVFFGVIVGLTIALPIILSKGEQIEKLSRQLREVTSKVRQEVEEREGKALDQEEG